MDYERLINGMRRFGSDETDICVHGLGIAPNQVQDNVVIAPWWEPETLPGLGKAEYLNESEYSAVKVWNIVSDNIGITYIKTGIGAPERNYRKFVRRELFPQIILETLHSINRM